ncbi:MAG: ribonuclease III [Oscillospiraceae bacterium]|nr:ribonuclease III [Oscillospiraceae bacterium]
MGDAVYELLVRSWLCTHGKLTNRDLHDACVGYVSARSQADAAETIREHLSPEEFEIFKRGRNAHTHSVPKNADTAQYHTATGLETLFGWLFLKGQIQRVSELFRIIAEDKNNAD